MPQATRVANFLDQDGVIHFNRNVYVKQQVEFRFLPAAVAWILGKV